MRLDLVHPVVSGNKWFKLQGYLSEAHRQGKKTIVTFGGAFSNHILATAAAARAAGLHSIGIIRGEEPAVLSPTLQDALAEGMELHFMERAAYREKEWPDMIRQKYPPEDLYLIPEGGYGRTGADGAATILQTPGSQDHEHIIAAVGTGTTLAGLALACGNHQTITGIPVLKNAHSLHEEINSLLPIERQEKFRLIEGYHFGGYARHKPELIHFMNELYAADGLPTDFVYTGKLFYAVHDLMSKGSIAEGSRVLVIHSGGLQGNRSLPKGTLIF